MVVWILLFSERCANLEKEAFKLSQGNSLTYPYVKKAIAKKHAGTERWYYDFVKGSFEIWVSNLTCFHLFPTLSALLSSCNSSIHRIIFLALIMSIVVNTLS